MMNPMELTGKTVIVTGASSGIGRETSLYLSRLGAKVVLVGRNVGRLEEAAAAAEFETVISAQDLTATSEISAWMKGIVREHGPISSVVHSAGAHTTSPVRMMSESKLEEIMRINFYAGVALAKAFCRKGVYAEQSSLIFVSSVMGLVGCAGVSAYVASKSALIGLTRSLALEFAPLKIRVNSVAPGQVATEMTRRMEESLTSDQFEAIRKMHPLGIGRPEDVASAIAFLASNSSRWITGTTLVVDGGYTAH
jgi:NAD(P)-dependent dehydrogenase (short-subunit alcohol dehydrogenase family)